MARRGIEHFPVPADWSESELRRLGYTRFSVSVFDHWLTREEWDQNPLVTLARAKERGYEANYFEQNRSFKRFYEMLFSDGVYRMTGSRLRPQVVWHPNWDRRLKKSVTAMVEDRTWGAEFYAPAHRLRVSSGDARTDDLLFEHSGEVQSVTALAKDCGLHLI